MNLARNIRACRRIVLFLAVYSSVGLGASIACGVASFGSPLLEPLAGSAIVGAFMLVICAAFVSNIRCPGCGAPYFAPAAVKHRLLQAKIPIRRLHCCNCSYDVFRATDTKKNQSGEHVVAPNRSLPPTLNSTSPIRGSED